MARRTHWPLAAGAVAAALLAVELLLRLQQAAGPFYDLELHDIGSVPSEVLNHEHAAREDWHLADAATYGAAAGRRYTVRYDQLGLRLDRFRAEPAGAGVPQVLLMGDSFVEGYDDANTLSAHVWETLRAAGTPARVFNAGASSYSPLLYTVQAQRLLPVLRPDLVVVVLDETDLGDDLLRYDALAEREARGRVVAVRSSPAHRAFAAGFLALKNEPPPTYLQRFLRRVYLARCDARTAAGRAGIRAVDPLVFARDTGDGARARHRDAVAAFTANLDALVEVLVRLQGDRRRVLLVGHPHREHLEPGADGRRWNRFVAEAARRVAARRGVAWFDAAPGLEAAFGATPAAYYWQGDMHFSFAGLEAYGTRLGAEIGRRLAAAGAG